jgi:deoxyadenosine/deoxycytidine kinase
MKLRELQEAFYEAFAKFAPDTQTFILLDLFEKCKDEDYKVYTMRVMFNDLNDEAKLDFCDGITDADGAENISFQVTENGIKITTKQQDNV